MILFRNADVYAPQPLGIQDVLIAGQQIVAMGKLPALAGFPVDEVDARGAKLLPGLIDGHTHMTGGGGEAGAETKVPPVPLTSFTRAGVTTAIGLLGTDCRTRTIAELLAAARGLDALGLTALCYTGGYEVPPQTLTGSARGDIVHIDRVIAIGETAISDHRSSQPTYEEIVKLAADAHVAGVLTKKAGLLHLHLGDGERGLAYLRRALSECELPARTWHPTHVNRNPRLWQEAMTLSALGPTIDLTAFPPGPDEPSAGTYIAEYLERGLDPTRLTMSSDGGGCLPEFDRDGVLVHMDVGASHSLLEAVAVAVDLGVPLEHAIATVTSNPARLFRLHRKGQIAVGADADMVLLGEGFAVDAVVGRGQWLVRAGQPVVRGPFEVRS